MAPHTAGGTKGAGNTKDGKGKGTKSAPKAPKTPKGK